MKKIKILFISCLCVLLGERTYAQVSITSTTPITIDFSTTLSGVNNGVYDGSGFTSSPANGDLDSDAWRFFGLSDGNPGFGETRNSGDFARGISAGHTASESPAAGLYAFTDGGNTLLGVSPASLDFTPGEIVLRLRNNMGTDIMSLTVTYKVKTFNRNDGTMTADLSSSNDDITYMPTIAPTFISSTTATDAWEIADRTAVIPAVIGNGTDYYLKWTIDEGMSVLSGYDEIGIDDIVITASTVALPVDLSSFAAVQTQEEIVLDWTTASEINNRYFQIERSTDGANFDPIGGVLGNGTTTETTNYQWIDENPISGLNYYRIKQLDFDGGIDYSNVVAVNFFSRKNVEFKLTPSLAKNYINIQFSTNSLADSKIEVYNMLGGLEKELIAGENLQTIQLDISDLSSGQYIIRYYTANQMMTKPFVKIK